MGISKEMKALIKSAEDQGWEVRKQRGGHIRLKPPNRKNGMVFAATTPSDPRALLNVKKEMQRRGLKL